MKKILILSLLFSLSLLTVSAQKYFKTEDGGFKIKFPGEPEREEQNVPTDVGDISMISYMYEESNEAVYMVAYSDYPEEYTKDADAYELLNSAKGGFLGNLGMEVSVDEQNELNGYKGVYFEANGGGYYTVVQDYMRDNRLYQIAILRLDRMLTEKEVDGFTKTFKFLK